MSNRTCLSEQLTAAVDCLYPLNACCYPELKVGELAVDRGCYEILVRSCNVLRRIAMGFLNHLNAILAVCIDIAWGIPPGFLNRVVVIATCAALAAAVAASAGLSRRKKYRRLTSTIPAQAGKVTQLNASVYQLHSPPPGKATMEVLFFHGFQHGDYKEAHLSTWKCRDGSSIWPQTWLVEKFPDARILSVSYNASLLKTYENKSIDMHIISENLTSDLLEAEIGQEPCRPVVLVGHSFGGLVIKHICVYASNSTGGLDRNSEKWNQLTAFLENVRGVFFYSTPHQGVFNDVGEHFVAEGPLLEYVRTLSTAMARVKSDFDNLCGQNGKYKMWQIAGLGESLPTIWGRFDKVVVEEGSARYGSNFNVVERVDHINVCRPMGTACRSFYALRDFLEGIAHDLQALVDGVPDDRPALTSRASEVQEMLRGSPVVGIVGMGGIGKSTIAKLLFDTLSPQFEYTCFVDDAKSMHRRELKDWLLNHFRRNGRRVEKPLEWSDLFKKKSLIVMDDVDSEDQVGVVPRLENFGSGSRLIFTTRDLGVLSAFPHCEIYEVSSLDFAEAKKLFCQHAFQQEEIPVNLMEINPHIEENVEKVVRKCDGLPLSLEVLGSYLRHKPKDLAWKETLEKVGQAQSVDGSQKDRLWSSLRVSYDALSPEEQGMFIEAGTFFFQEEVEVALAAWSTSYGCSETRWANLLTRFLVKEEDLTEYDETTREYIPVKRVKVHEHFRDLAKHLSKGSITPTSEEDADRVLDLLNANEVEAKQKQTPIVRLRIERVDRNLRLDMLDYLEELKYLELYGIVPHGSGKHLSGKLLLLKCHSVGYHMDEIDHYVGDEIDADDIDRMWPPLPVSVKAMKNLGVLDLHRWEMEEESLEAMGELKKLRILSLSRIKGPTRLPDNIGDLSQLKRLVLRDVGLTGLPRSFGNLSALEHLALDTMGGLVELPESFGNLSSLVTLGISQCRRLASLPESFGNLSSLVTLGISQCHGLASLPKSFGRLSKVTELSIVDCPSLACQEPTELGEVDSHEHLFSLKSLYLEKCPSLERLPASFELLLSLEELDLSGCTHLKALPDTIGQFKCLKRLAISGCHDLEALPDSFGNLAALTHLELRDCGSLKSLPASFGNLAALQELVLSHCREIRRLADNFSQLGALKKLRIAYAHPRQGVADGFSTDGDLTEGDCWSREILLQFWLHFVAWRDLDNPVLDVDAAESPAVGEKLGALSGLEVSWLEELVIVADTLQRFPEGFPKLPALRKLTIQAEMLTSLPDKLGSLPCLRRLVLQHCRSLEALPDSLGRSSSLGKVRLNSCERLKSLPETLGRNFSPN